MHFNLAFFQCSTSIYQENDEQTEFLWELNFMIILSYLRNLRKFDAQKKYVFYGSSNVDLSDIKLAMATK